MKNLISVIVVVLLLATTISKGQTNFGVSGTAAGNSNGTANNVSNDLFTGTATVNVPLVSKNVDGIDVGVSINYNTKGIRLDDVSSTVGLGWNLNYGGVISRVVRGLPDDYIFVEAGYYYNRGYWFRTNDNIPYYIGFNNNIPKHMGDLEPQGNIGANAADGQMDIFTLMVNGIKVEFMINANNEVITIPNNSRVKIQRTFAGNVINSMPQGQSVSDIGFLVTDESGNKFYFIGGEKVKIVPVTTCPSGPIPNNNNNNYTTEYYNATWIIDRIETYNGKLIQYTYNDYLTYHLKATVSEEFLDVSTNENCLVNPQRGEVDQENKTRLIDKIQFPDLEVSFSYNNTNTEPRRDLASPINSRFLKFISTKEKNNVPDWNNLQGSLIAYEKRISFVQDYFDVDENIPSGVSPLNIGNAIDDYKRLRLRLKEIKYGISPNTRTLFSFDYFEPNADVVVGNNGNGFATPLRLNPCQDYWGYYNGNDVANANSVALYIPLITGSFSPLNILQGINREPTTVDKTKLFALRTITNEAKGCTEFFYGLNEVIINGSTKKLDGLRIEEVHNYTIGMNDNTTRHITKYEYENGEWIVPKLTYPNIDDLFKRNIWLHCAGNPGQGYIPPPVYVPNFFVFSNHFLGQLDEIQHGYGKVTVVNKKNYNSKNIAQNQIFNELKEVGKTENYFTTMKNLPPDVLNIHGNSLSGNPFTVNLNNLILNAPIPYTQFNGLTLNNTNYAKPFDSYPFTYKQYYIQWALGIQYKTINYDATGHKATESLQEFDVYVKSMNTDNFINLHATSNYYFDQPNDLNCTPSNLLFDYYHPYVGRIELKKNTAKTYINDNDIIQKSIDYEYDPITGYPRKTIETQANNAIVENREFYNSDNSNWNNNAHMTTMLSENVNKNIHSEIWRKEPNQNTFKLLNATGSGFANINGRIRNTHSYHLVGKSLLTQSPILNNIYTIADANAGNVIPNFIKGSTVTKYDKIGNVCEINKEEKYASYIYDHYQDALLAEISNARFSEVAYNSFESNIYETNDNSPLYNQDKGNWTFHPAGINFTQGMTGNRCYNLGANYYDQANALQSVELKTSSEVSLIPNRKYIISFWKKTNSTISITNFNPANQTQAISFTTYHTNASPLSFLNGWTYCEANFTATYEKIKITGAGNDCFIDELRLYPADATMTTQCFSPLSGKITTCDAFNQIVRFEFNEDGRFQITRDIKGSILSKTKKSTQSND